MIVEWSALWKCVLWWIFHFLMILTKTLKCGEVHDIDLLYLIHQAADLNNAHGSTKPSFRPATSPPFWSFPSASCLLLKQHSRCFQVAYFPLAFWVPLKCWSFSDVLRLSESVDLPGALHIVLAIWVITDCHVGLCCMSALLLCSSHLIGSFPGCCWWWPGVWWMWWFWPWWPSADQGDRMMMTGWWLGGCGDFNLDDHQLTSVIGWWWWQGDDKVGVVVLTLMTISWPRWSDDADRVMTRWMW